MEYINVPVTKLADNCQIPRPSMTQLLKGRNKKVSDEVISKIHVAYPQLSILWLLFGEGEMVNESNMQISEPENQQKFIDFDSQIDEYKFDISNLDTVNSDSEKLQNRIETVSASNKSNIKGSNTRQVPYPSNYENSEVKINCNIHSEKRHVVNIMVFYSDMSFESFVPQKEIKN
ncbi:MAG: hypothetical protein NC343_05035 [Muribaculum sp.]|nr:hypothetical protein [Muribaculum sp.]